MKVFRDLSLWNSYKNNINLSHLGFVPTMGALHQGHGALVTKSLQENKTTVVSIFVNSTQFNNPEDFQNYPVTLKDDLQLLNELGVDAVLLPSYKELYPFDYTYSVDESQISTSLCGKDRPGHFKGVLTVVMKLLNLTEAARAYFGEKDYQQFLLIRNMAKAFFMNVEIISVKTVRDAKGLALSSRNLRLNEGQLEKAQTLNKIITSPGSLSELAQNIEKLGLQLDYLEDKWKRRFVAARLGPVRIIDNVPL